MNQLESNRIIYAAIAAPGAGKTEALLTKLPDLISQGKRILLALPTIVLSDEIARRASSKGITCWPIDHRAGEIVVDSLEAALAGGLNSFIICTQESVRRVKPHLLRDWILVLDEIPKVVDYPNFPLNTTELERVLQYTEERDGQLHILEGQESVVQEQVSTHRGDARGIDCSTLGNSAARIFRLLLCEIDVFIDQPTPQDKRHVRAVEEFKDWWNIIASAAECHILAASIKNSEFELFAQVHGFQFKESEFKSKWRPDSSTVTIYPVMPKGQKFSWSKMTALHEGKRLIDITLAKVLERTSSPPLLTANKWASFKSTPGVIYVPKDCRGLNIYTDATEAVVLFGGNPSPSDSQGLVYLATKYGVDFEEAFVTNRLLEPTLQAVARTAIRCRDNTDEIKFYVQDYRVVDYLLSTYFPDAKVDWSLTCEIPVKRDGRKTDEKVEDKIISLICSGFKDMEIHRQTGVSRRKIKKMRTTHQAA